MVGGSKKAPVHRSASMTLHSSSASTRRVNTFVPPITKVDIVVIIVATWNSGPAFK